MAPKVLHWGYNPGGKVELSWDERIVMKILSLLRWCPLYKPWQVSEHFVCSDPAEISFIRFSMMKKSCERGTEARRNPFKLIHISLLADEKFSTPFNFFFTLLFIFFCSPSISFRLRSRGVYRAGCGSFPTLFNILWNRYFGPLSCPFTISIQFHLSFFSLRVVFVILYHLFSRPMMLWQAYRTLNFSRTASSSTSETKSYWTLLEVFLRSKTISNVSWKR